MVLSANSAAFSLIWSSQCF